MLLMDATLRTKMMCFERKSKQNIRAAHFVYLALGARSAPSDVGFAKDYKFRANSPPGADTWITGGGGCGPWCGLKETCRNVSKNSAFAWWQLCITFNVFNVALAALNYTRNERLSFQCWVMWKSHFPLHYRVWWTWALMRIKGSLQDSTGANIRCFKNCLSCIWHFLQKLDITFPYMNQTKSVPSMYIFSRSCLNLFYE